PRSGTIPASLIATYLVKPLASVDEWCAGICKRRKSDTKRIGSRILLVDDSLRTGKQMREAIDRINTYRPGTEVKTLAVYYTDDLRGDERVLEPDIYLHAHGDSFYLFPWFMWKTNRLEHVASDLDGVLCRDATCDEDDDGPAYAKFIETAEQKFKPHFGGLGW